MTLTRLVATLSEKTPEGMVEAARRVDADLVEVRLDALDRVDENAIETIARDVRRPALATLRPRREGGAYDGTESQRAHLLAHAIDVGFPYVDVEGEADVAPGLIARALRRGTRVVLSRHDYHGTPDAETVLGHLRDARARDAWCGKYAVTIRNAEDAASLVTAATAARRDGLRFALMGVNDAFLRLLAPALGQALAYVAADSTKRAAPGQPLAAEARRVHADLEPAITARTQRIYLYGDPVAHSLSPGFQNAALQAAGVDAVYVAARVPPENLAGALAGLRATGAVGANLTIPHKEAAVHLLDTLAPTAARAGAVNTIVNEGGRLVGHNTDGVGALRALEAAGAPVDGRRVLVTGAGGAARAVAFALKDAGATVAVANRTRDRAEGLAREVDATVAHWPVTDLSPYDIVVNCTSLGLATDDAPLPDGVFLPSSLTVFDAVYRTAGDTPLAARARRAGCTVVTGRDMLFHQGVVAFELWTGERAPVDVMRRALGGLV